VGWAEGDPRLESRSVRIVTIAAAHNHAATLPGIQPLAMTSAGPRADLFEVAAGTDPVTLFQTGAFAGLDCQECDVVRCMAGGADAAYLLWMDRPDVVVGVGDALVGHLDLPAEMT
jgi:hypothetical protein